MLDIHQILKRNEMLAALSNADREELALTATTQRFERGRHLPADERTQPVIVVGHGLLKTIVGAPGPSVEPVVSLHEPGSLANEIQLLDPQVRSLRIVAVTEAVVGMLDRDVLLTMLARNPKAALELAKSAAKAAGDAYSKISSSRFSVEERTAAALLQLADDYGDEMHDGKLMITLPLKRGELAGYIGSTTESVIRVLSAWRRDGTIGMEEGGRIEILDRKTLESASSHLRRYHAAA